MYRYNKTMDHGLDTPCYNSPTMTAGLPFEIGKRLVFGHYVGLLYAPLIAQLTRSAKRSDTVRLISVILVDEVLVSQYLLIKSKTVLGKASKSAFLAVFTLDPHHGYYFLLFAPV